MLHLLVYLVLAGILPLHVTSDSDVGFPERDHVDIERNKTRVPLYIPGKCPPNQLLYPGNQKTDWICDCTPGYLYYAPKDGCYEAFRQGPCAYRQYLTLEAGEFNPKCTSNKCNDGEAFFKGQCYRLNTDGPCDTKQGSGIFGVNTTTLTLGCIKGGDRISTIADANDNPPH